MTHETERVFSFYFCFCFKQAASGFILTLLASWFVSKPFCVVAPVARFRLLILFSASFLRLHFHRSLFYVFGT